MFKFILKIWKKDPSARDKINCLWFWRDQTVKQVLVS